MLDPNLLRNDIDAVAKALKIKGYDLDVEAYQSLESERKALQVESEELQAKRKARSKEIGKTKAQGGDVDALMAEVASFADQLKASQEKLEEVQDKLLGIAQSIPNIPDESVPAGNSEDDNVEISKWGTPREFSFEPKDHVDLGEALGELDFETATKITGSRFVVMKKGCLLYTSPSPRDLSTSRMPSSA